jgi:general secretion pathway protein A
VDTSTAVLTGAPLYVGAFGLAEAPFSTTPDQRFVYLSDHHRDALAHLLYGVAQRGGFVQLTGEVGTGKTTLCRYLLEHLPGHVDVALILNPTVTRLELLATICDELRIAYPAGSTSVKALVDALYAHLLDAHARGRHTVVIVDEAQHLDGEVLEQLRLLTNLETGRAKLLQIILIGQPELVDLMSRKDLRQVSQRVAARYHLAPLTERETRAYVRHRLAMAGQPADVFDEPALRAVHRASSGVPRLVNVVCDRALLGAYATHGERVTRTIVDRAAREIAGESADRGARRRRAMLVAAGAAAAVGVAVGLVLAARGPLKLGATTARDSRPAAPIGGVATPPAVPAPASAVAMAVPPTPAASPAATPASPKGAALRALLADAASADADQAYAAIVARWGRRYERRPNEQPCEAVRRSGLDCIARRGTWNVVRKFDLPAVLEITSASGAQHHLAVVSADEGRARVQLGSRTELVSLDDIEREWDGSFVLLWKPPRPGMDPIGRGASGPDVTWLRRRLGTVDGQPMPAPPVARAYDDALTARVVAFQRAHGLSADGIAGAETLAKLNAVLDPGTPSLRRAGSPS